MDSKPSDPNLSFITAMYDPNDTYMQGNQQCTPDGMIDHAEEGLKIEALLQMALNDIKNLQNRLAETRDLLPEDNVNRVTMAQ